jgi:type VII secretion integral membrane protein EccD
MTSPVGPTLARVTVAAPVRRMDVALPDNMIVAELLPHLLRHAGDALGDSRERPGGWVLRRATGTTLEPQRNLAVQGVRDGELLHLTPVRDDWPELAYDDVVEVIAGGARRAGRAWSGAATRRTGLVVAALTALFGLVGLVAAGPDRSLPAVLAIIVAVALLVVGVLLSRAFADSHAGAIVAAAGLPYAFFGGAWLVIPDGAAFLGFGTAGLLLGSAVLLVISVLGNIGVAGLPRLFTAGIATAVAGLIASLLGLAGLSSAGAAAVTLTVAIGMLPSYPVVAGWIGRLPFPELPNKAEEILKDKPMPRRADVFAAVVRAGEILTGLLLAASISGVVAIAYLMADARSTASILLIIDGVAALLLRARLLPTPQQRVPLLVAGLIGTAVLGTGAAVVGHRAAPGLLVLAGSMVIAAVALISGLVFGRRAPSPYLGRAGDILDVLAIMALIPLACAVIGIFDSIRGLFATIGG